MRSKKAFYSFVLNTIAQLVNTVLALVVRRAFIQRLGVDLLGLNSLYSSIVSFLSLAELGFGQSVAMCLFKSLSEGDNDKVARYMGYLKRIYTTVGIVIIATGVLISPFIYFATDISYPRSFISLTFVLYVIATAVTYFFSYKKILISADQNNYIIAGIQLLFKLLLNGLQLVVLIFFQNYYLFLLVLTACNIGENILASKICNNKYPYIKDKPGTLAEEDRKDLITKIKGLLFYKVGNYIIQGSDNIIISIMLGTQMVAYFSNFNLITTILYSIFSHVGYSALAGLGNILYTDRYNLKKAFFKLLIVQNLVFCVSTAGFVTVSRTFVYLMFGIKGHISMLDIVAMAIAYDLRGYSFALENVRNSAGLYEKDKHWNIIAAFVNVVLSVALAIPLGITGIMIGTIVSFFIKEVIIVPQIVFTDILPGEMKWYFNNLFKHYCLIVILIVIAIFLDKRIYALSSVAAIIIGGIAISIIASIASCLIYCKTDSYKELKESAKAIVLRIFRRART